MYALSPACGVWHAAPRARRNRCRSVPLATADNDTASPPQAPSCSSSRVRTQQCQTHVAPAHCLFREQLTPRLAGTPPCQRAALLLAATAATTVAAPPPPAYAGLSSYDVTGKGIANASMALGAKDSNAFAFLPSELSFTQGQVTKLKLTNPSQVEHYFSAREFASKVFTIAVESNGLEVKGAVTEVCAQQCRTARLGRVHLRWCHSTGGAGAGGVVDMDICADESGHVPAAVPRARPHRGRHGGRPHRRRSPLSGAEFERTSDISVMPIAPRAALALALVVTDACAPTPVSSAGAVCPQVTPTWNDVS